MNSSPPTRSPAATPDVQESLPSDWGVKAGGPSAFTKYFSRYFLRGLLLVTPLAVTAYVLVAVWHWVDNLLPLMLPRVGRVPGAGILVMLLGILFIGFLGSSLLARPLFLAFERILNRLPLVRIIYTSLKDLVSAFVGENKKFDQPVLVLLDESSHMQRLGFMTRSDLSLLGITGQVAVYLPYSLAFSGELCLFPAERVQPIDASSADVMKFIVSGGVTGLTGSKTGSNPPRDMAKAPSLPNSPAE